MNLKIRDGQLTLGSVFKIVIVGWACFGGVFVGGIFLLLVIIAAVTGQMTVNGEVVYGRSAALGAMAPMILFLPLVIAVQGVIFGAFITMGAALYRLRRPLSVTAEVTTPSSL